MCVLMYFFPLAKKNSRKMFIKKFDYLIRMAVIKMGESGRPKGR